ncbi:MAG: hypothetical protein NVSMB65_03000 [Chloroflexota bacterium]
MRYRSRGAGLAAMCVGLILTVSSSAPSALARHGAATPARAPVIVIRQVATLDARGHVLHVVRAGGTIKLRITWTVRNAPPHAIQTTLWTVTYGGREMLHVSKSDAARNGTWSRVTDVTVTRTPHPGPHTFWGKITVGPTTATRAVTFSVRP